jgi:hypothetical protein
MDDLRVVRSLPFALSLPALSPPKGSAPTGHHIIAQGNPATAGLVRLLPEPPWVTDSPLLLFCPEGVKELEPYYCAMSNSQFDVQQHQVDLNNHLKLYYVKVDLI